MGIFDNSPYLNSQIKV